MHHKPESHAQEHRALTEKAITGAKWIYLGTAVRIVAQFLGQILLSRILGPAQVGQFAYAFLVVSLMTLLLEMGLGSALVQRPKLDQRTIGIATGRLLGAGVVGALVQCIYAERIAAEIFNQPSVACIIQVMSGSYIVSALSVPVMAQLRRKLAFREIQRAQMYSYFMSYLLIGVASAALGAGVWSLVIAWYSNLFLQFVIVANALPRSLAFAMPFKRMGAESYGMYVVFTNVVNWAIDSLAAFIVGRYWGATQLGLYNTSNNIVRVPANHLVTTLQQVLFAAISRLQHDDRISALAYKLAVSVVLSVALPLFCYIALASDLIVSMLLGSEWKDAAQLLRPLSLAMIPHALMAVGGPVLNGKGKPERELVAQSLSLLLITFVLAMCVGYSIEMLVWAVFVAYSIRSLVITFTVAKSLKIGLGDFVRTVFPSVLIGVVFFYASIVALMVLESSGFGRGLMLLLSFSFAVMAFLVVLFVFPYFCVTQEMAWLLKRLLGSRKSRIIDRIASHARL